METKLEYTYYCYQLTGENWRWIHQALMIAYVVDPDKSYRKNYQRIINLLEEVLLDDLIVTPKELNIIHDFLRSERRVKKARRMCLKGFSKKLIEKISLCLKKIS